MRRLLPQSIKRRLAPWPTWAALLLLAALACQPLLGLPPRGHDAFLHYYRIPAVSQLWQNGIFFSRWLPDLIYGYGSPLFNFYPPLSAYLLTALYWLLGQNGLLAYNLAYALALLLTVAGMFLLGRHLFGATGGLLAAAAYTLAPHVLLQTYSRGSLSNALALAFAPLAVLALLRLSQDATRRGVALAALAVALVLLSHIAAGLLLMPVLLFLALAASRLLRRSPSAPPLAPLLAALLLGLALAAFAWLPGLAEIGATRYAQSVNAAGVDFADHFAVALSWPAQTIARLAKTPLPHSIGLLQLLQGAAAVLLAPLLWWRKKARRPAARVALFVSAGGLLGLGLLFLATPPAAWFWENIAPLRQLQYPWRLLDVPVLLLPLAAAWWATVLRPRWRPWLLGAGLILIYLNALPYLYPSRLASVPAQPTPAGASAAQQDRGIMGLTAWGEYSSDRVRRWPTAPPFAGADDGAPLAHKLRLPPSVQLRASGGGLLHATWDLNLPAPTALTLAVHYFPGWRALLDGSPLPIAADQQGRMRLELPAGAHRLSLSWTRTPVRWLADALSLLALVVVGWLALRRSTAPLALSSTSLAPADESRRDPSRGDVAPLWLPALLAILLLFKVAVFDVRSTPLVLHPDAQHIPGVPRPPHGDFGVFRLLGYERSAPQQLVLYWYAPRQVTEPYSVRLTVADALGVPLQETVNLYPGDNLTTSWGPGLVVRDVYTLALDELPAPGGYQLSVAVLDTASEQPLPLLDGPPGATTVGLGSLKRAPPSGPPPLTVPAPALDVSFGDAITLTHVLLPETAQRGERLPLTLYWQSAAPVAQDYTVFLHLLRPDGEFVAAYDAQPLDGRYPTSFWQPGEQIADPRRLLLDVPPGDYLLHAGLYDLESGERLPLSPPHEGVEDGVIIGTVEVRP